MRVWWLVFLVLLAAGCEGGGSKQSTPGKPPPKLAQRCGDDAKGVEAKQVWFRASDRALLDDAILPNDATLAALLIAAMVGLLLLHALGDLANHYLVARAVASVMSDLRLRIFTHLQRLSVSFYARSRAGDLLARFTTDLEGIERALADEVPQAIYCILTVLAGAALLVVIEWRLALVLLVLLPALPILPRAPPLPLRR